jgi:hypothetical protein
MAELACNRRQVADRIMDNVVVSLKGAKMPATAIVDTAVLDEVVHWIKSLTAVGVSPDTAAQVTSQFFLTACEMVAEGEEEGEDYEDFDE